MSTPAREGEYEVVWPDGGIYVNRFKQARLSEAEAKATARAIGGRWRLAAAPAVAGEKPAVYRIRIRSDGSAWRKGAWILHRDSFDDIARAREAAQAQARTGRLVRVTTTVSVKALAEFDGREG